MKITREFIEKIPKTDLHLHLDGSIRLSTLIALAEENDISLRNFFPKDEAHAFGLKGFTKHRSFFKR